MTQIDFYTGVADKLRTACVLTAKSYERKFRVFIHTPDVVTTEALDRLLWTT
ncbi:MAG: DNA polymerase III subunit chi, partial [Burkholderiales bacterium]